MAFRGTINLGCFVASDELSGGENGESWWVMTPLLMVASPQKIQLKNDHFDVGNTYS